MRHDLIEIIDAMIEWRRQILAECPIHDTGAAHQRQRPSHQPARRIENHNAEHGADDEIETARITVALDEIGVIDPLVQAAIEADAADSPAHKALKIGLGGEVGDKSVGQKDQEADMDAAHRLAREKVPRSHHDLEGGERNANDVSDDPPPARAETLGKAVLEIIEIDF